MACGVGRALGSCSHCMLGRVIFHHVSAASRLGPTAAYPCACNFPNSEKTMIRRACVLHGQCGDEGNFLLCDVAGVRNNERPTQQNESTFLSGGPLAA